MSTAQPDHADPDRPLYVVLGATGGIGRAVVAAAAARGHRVRAVSRTATAATTGAPGAASFPPGVEVLDADVSTPAGATAAVRGAAVVVHAAQPPYTRWRQEFPALTGTIADATATAGAKLVLADNLYMYGPQPPGQPMTELTRYAATDRKGRVRAAMAADLLERHARGDLRVTLGRASDYYGPHGTGSSLGEVFFGAALRSKPIRAVRSVHTPHTMAYLPDLAAGLLTLAEHDSADGHAWHLPAAEPITAQQLADLLAAHLNRPVPLRAASPGTLRLLGLAVPMLREIAAIAYQWQQPFLADHRRFAAAFPDAVHVTPHPDAVAATATWYAGAQARPQARG